MATAPGVLVLASVGALALGPVLVAIGQRRRGALHAIDAFVLFAIGGLAALHVLPEVVEQAGARALVAALLGFATPSLLERLPRRRRGPASIEMLGIVALGLHAFVDGAALSLSRGPFLALATLLHRVPEGVVVWTLARTIGTVRRAALVLGAVAALNAVGVLVGVHVASVVESDAVAVLQAFAMGTLVHVLLDRSAADACRPSTAAGRHAMTGAVLATVTVAAVTSLVSDRAGAGAMRFFVDVFARSAPAVLGAACFALALQRVARGAPGAAPTLEAISGRPVRDGAPASSFVAASVLSPISTALTWSFFGPACALARVALGAVLVMVLRLGEGPLQANELERTTRPHILELASRSGMGVLLGSALAAILAPVVPLGAPRETTALLSVGAGLLSPLQGAANAALAGAHPRLSTFAFLLVADAANVRLLARCARSGGAQRALFIAAVVLVGVALASSLVGDVGLADPPETTTIQRIAGVILAGVIGWGIVHREPRGLIRDALGLRTQHDHRGHAARAVDASVETTA